MTTNYTTEQQAIINSTANTIVVQALAGTGKTSTLIGYVKARPNWTFLYLAYNKAIADEVAQRFPANVESCTVHSLAYRTYGRAYQHKLGNNRLRDLTAALELSEQHINRVKQGLEAVNNWLLSDVDELSAFINNTYKRHSKIEELLLDAPAIWNMMLDKNNSTIKMPHDGYLKLYQLSKPLLQYDALLLDEAQDSNNVTIALVNAARCSHKIIIGDSHQSIYSFRGATDALAQFAKIDGAAVFGITTCFRFNQVIADYATSILQRYKLEKQTMIGGGEHGDVQLYNDIESLPQYTTILARNNFSLFAVAISQVNKGNKVYFCGGIGRYDLATLHAIIDLHTCKKFTHVFINKFKSYSQLKAYAYESEESDLIFACAMLEEYGGYTLCKLLDKLVSMDSYISANPMQRLFECHFQLTTAHRSKGLQFKRVAVYDDFSKLDEMLDNDFAQRFADGKLSEFDAQQWIDEINLYYVACTRATQVLLLPKKI